MEGAGLLSQAALSPEMPPGRWCQGAVLCMECLLAHPGAQGPVEEEQPRGMPGSGAQGDLPPLAGQVVLLTQPLSPPPFSGLRDTQAVSRAALGTHARRKASRQWGRCLCSSTLCVCEVP